MMVNGERVAGFIQMRDVDGQRHCVRATCVLCLSDTEDFERTAVTLTGGRCLIVDLPLDQVLAWFGQ